LLLVGVDERVVIRHRAPVAVAIIGVFVVLAAVDAVELPLLAVAAAAACLVTGCISLGRAIREVDWNVLGLLAGAITLGFALHKCELDRSIAHGVVAVTRDLGPTAVLSAVYLLTSLATELVSNSGAAALMVPIALATANELRVDAHPFAFAVAFAASASFATPVGYQTNTFILGPGGYRFADFVKVGLPLQIILWIYASFMLPVFFPFHPH
jgi:di/tricarboxylate transporter